MMNNNQIPYSVQDALFQKVTLLFRNRAAAIADYCKKFPGIPESTARARFNSTHSIPYDHGMEIASCYNFHDLDVWPQGWPENHFVATKASDMDAYIDTLFRDLQQLAAQGDATLYVVTGGIPLLLLKKYRHLAGFLLYYIFVLDVKDPALKHLLFGPTFMQHPKVVTWLDRFRTTLDAYQKTKGVEYWSPSMFNHLLVKLKWAKRNEVFEDPDLSDKLYQDIAHLIRDMEDTVTTGEKCIGPNSQGAKVAIFNHEGIINDTAMIGDSSNIRFAYLDQGIHQLHRFQANMVDQQLKRVAHLSQFSQKLGGVPIHTTRFFDKLKKNIALSYSD